MRFSTPAQWLAWLEQLHPRSIELGLERVALVWGRMGLSLSGSRVVTVAGTNGKGSSVAMLEAIYLAGGYTVCSYTSPHLERYNERIHLNGRHVSDAGLCEAFDAVDRARGETTLSYFEFGTLAAFYLFARTRPDLIILEVGLGGRLDAVNLIDADVALITSIDRDHEAWLGSEIDQIAREKGGIMRAGRPAVFSGSEPPLGLLQVAEELQAELLWRGRDYRMDATATQWSWRMGDSHFDALPIPALRGRHQIDNAAAVLAVVELMQHHLPVDQTALSQGLSKVSVAGRFQVIPGETDRVFDVAHNPHGARALAAALADMPCSGRTLAVFGILADKDAGQVLQPLVGLVDGWYLAPPDSERAKAPAELLELLQGLGAESAQIYDGVTDAYRAAWKSAGAGDRILLFGSFYTVAEVLRLL